MADLRHPNSLWRETASSAPEPQVLEGGVEADIAIIGGGYTGLSAALRAVERGLAPVVLEASEVGWGASGRNGGVVSSKYRYSLADMAKRHGLEVARRMHRIGHDAMDCVENNVETLQIADAGYVRSGNLRCAHHQPALDRLVAEADTAREMFGDDSVRVLDAEETRHETGSTGFAGGVLSTHAGIIHPLNYALGLAASVRARGGRIFERSPVTTRERTGATTRLVTSRGSVSAKKVLVATNGYSELTRATDDVRRAVIPFRSAMVATETLPDALAGEMMRESRSYSETRRMMRWFRPFAGRMIFGGRGAFGREDSEAAFRDFESAMKSLFPQLEGVRVTHRWSGLVAMTMDGLPQVGLIDRNTGFALGYNGAGIALSSLIGGRVVDLMLGAEPELGLMRRRAPEAIPFYSLREPAVRTVAAWYQFLDQIGR